MAITLYHAPATCAFAPLVALEQAGATYDLVTLSLAAGDQRRADHLAIHPLGRVPALAVDGTVITETVAILGWIDAQHPGAGILPADPLARARAFEIIVWIASTVHVALAGVRRPERFADDPAIRAALAAPGRAAFTRALDRLEGFADTADAWFVGDRFGAVDAYALVVRRWAEGLGIDPAGWPAWHDRSLRALAHPAVRRASTRERAVTALAA